MDVRQAISPEPTTKQRQICWTCQGNILTYTEVVQSKNESMVQYAWKWFYLGLAYAYSL